MQANRFMTAYWRTLVHNGVSFPDKYAPQGFSLPVRDRVVVLTPLGEEMAYQLAKKRETPYIKDQVFISNFMKDFAGELPPWCMDAKFTELDFTEFFRRADQERAAKEGMTKGQRRHQAEVRKERRERLREKHGHAILDGKDVEMANWMVEPPGLFMGRGQHPMRGRWKPEVSQTEVVLNLGESAPVPHGDWKDVVHDHDSMWMAKWVDKLTWKEKYVWLHESSPLQQSRNQAKYDNALKVGRNLGKIQSMIQKGLDSRNERERQVATVCYLIDRLGMRVGDEKDEDEADTVGASTLRVEHVKLEGDTVEFDFLGKDSVQWRKRDSPSAAVIRNLDQFTRGKSPELEIFHNVSSSMVNEFLSSIVPGVTAKVFRTYHATAKTEDALRSKDVRHADELVKLYHAREANLKAAEFCNHQRTPPKTWQHSLERKEQRLTEVQAKGKSDQMVRKLKMELDFFRRTKNYNLNTSVKNYIDPRVYKAWCDYVGMEWARIYSKSMQRKFSWVAQSRRKWNPEPLPVSTLVKSEAPSQDSP